MVLMIDGFTKMHSEWYWEAVLIALILTFKMLMAN